MEGNKITDIDFYDGWKANTSNGNTITVDGMGTTLDDLVPSVISNSKLTLTNNSADTSYYARICLKNNYDDSYNKNSITNGALVTIAPGNSASWTVTYPQFSGVTWAEIVVFDSSTRDNVIGLYRFNNIHGTWEPSEGE